MTESLTEPVLTAIVGTEDLFADVVDNQKDGVIYKLGRQSLDNVRLRHLLRTGKNTSCPNMGWIFLFFPILYSY